MLPSDFLTNSLASQRSNILKTFKRLTQRAATLPEPLTSKIIEKYGKDPFLILISCLLSLRNRDTVTYPVCEKLFSYAQTPEQFLSMPLSTLEHLIKSVNFYRRKAHLLHTVSQQIIDQFKGRVPHTAEQLSTLPGVGPKTISLVLDQAFGKPSICVDTHVQKISERLGWVTTKDPVKTQAVLEKIFPKKYWSKINEVLVKWGQNRCKKTADTCPFHDLCIRIYPVKTTLKTRR